MLLVQMQRQEMKHGAQGWLAIHVLGPQAAPGESAVFKSGIQRWERPQKSFGPIAPGQDKETKTLRA